MSIIDWILIYIVCGLISFLFLTAHDRNRKRLPEDDSGFFGGMVTSLAIWPICIAIIWAPGVISYLKKERVLKS